VIGLDTNILVRLVLQDDAKQFEQAAALLANAYAQNRSAFVSLIALTELAWVLQSSAKIKKQKIADEIEAFLDAEDILVEQSDLVRKALVSYRSLKIDFADALIAAVNVKHGCTRTVSFDKAAIKSGLMSAP
jgi:predicted nucleic-acid-binding protein